MQVVIEDYCGHQRTQQGRSDYPSAQQFGYNNITIAAQRDIASSVKSNTGGRYAQAKCYTVGEEAGKKRKRN